MISYREYLAQDVDRLVELANNKKVTCYMVYTFPYPYTQQAAEWWVNEGCRANNSVNKVIEVDGVFVGSVGVAPQTGWREHVADIGYWLGEEFWGKGLATQALTYMTEQAFEQLHFRKLSAPVLGENKASIRVLEKCGYELEGIQKEDVTKDGAFYDVHLYAKHRH